MALAMTDDRAAQERVWETAPEWRRTPQALRAALTESKVDAATDRRIHFIGIEAYTAAGGHLERDLFQPEHEGYLTDPALLDRLVAEKLEAVAAAVRAEGWGWVEISPGHPPLHEYGRIRPARVPLSPEAAAELAALESERDGLDERYDGEAEYPEEAATRLEAIESRIDQIQEDAEAYRPEEQALAGAIVALSGGEAAVYRGLVRKADRSKLEGVRAGNGAGPQATPEGEPEGQAGYSGALTESLTAQRTAALRAALAERPDLALVAVTHNLALQTFYRSYQTPSALEIRVNQEASVLVRHEADLEPTRAGKALEEARGAWERQLPRDPGDLWAWLLAREQSAVLELLAWCAAQTVNAVRLPHQHPGDARLGAADRLAEALALDMADWWRPTAAGFFMRVKREQAMDALVEATGAKDVIALSKLKKSELAAEAEKRLADCRWLPSIFKP